MSIMHGIVVRSSTLYQRDDNERHRPRRADCRVLQNLFTSGVKQRIFTLRSSVTHNVNVNVTTPRFLHARPLGPRPARRPRASPRRDVPFPLRGARGSLISYITSFYFVSSSVVRTVDTARAHALGLTDCLTTRPSHSVHSDSNMHLCVLPCSSLQLCTLPRVLQLCTPRRSCARRAWSCSCARSKV